MIVLIDNYDSFTYNLYHYLMECGATVEVIRNDACSVAEILEKNPSGIVISPGPCSPNEAGLCLDLIQALPTSMPLLGVCLGHQSLAQAFGATICRGARPMHAVVSKIAHHQAGLFKEIPSPFKATRYHSLQIDEPTLPVCFRIDARSEDGVIQAITHQQNPWFGVQFHPESIESEYGHTLLAQFYRYCALGMS